VCSARLRTLARRAKKKKEVSLTLTAMVTNQ
jgi:hypothetical protein